MENYYVYAHIDKETNAPFYIGRGQGKRAFDKSRNEYWKNFVSKYSKDYQVQFLAKEISEDIAYDIENEFISKLGKAFTGKGLLLNWTSGGYAEGAYINLFEDESQDYSPYLTEFGKQLLKTDKNSFDLHKIRNFINDIAANKIHELRQQMLNGISKKTNPKKAWIIPFCTNQKLRKNDSLTINITEQSKLMKELNKNDILENLPFRPFTDFLVHRIMMYFDLFLQENIWLEKNDSRCTKADPEWYFYKGYSTGYIKVIQAMNSGFNLNVKFIGRNKKDRNRKDIYDFEISKEV